MNKATLPDALLKDFSQFLTKNFAVYFPKQKYRELEKGILNIMPHFNLSNAETLIHTLRNSILTPAQIAIIASEFTIGETYFFRDKAIFDALKLTILPQIIKSRRETGKYIRIWSAGCSTGEEIYSIAIILSQLIPDIESWNITLLATDINVNSLTRLKEGVYSDWSFRNDSENIKAKYFKQTGKNRYEIHSKFIKMVTSEYLNLAQDTYPALLTNTTAMDLILCRNCIMYFSPPFIEKIISQFKRALVEDGYFAVGGSESSLIPVELFHIVHASNAIYFKNHNQTSNQINVKNNDTLFFEILSSDFAQDTHSESITDSHINKRTIQSNPIKANNKVTSILSQAKSTEVNPDLLQSYVHSLDKCGDLPKAIHSIKEAIHKDKCNTILHYLLGLTLHELGEINQAISAFNKAIYLDPNFILAYFSLGNIERNRKQWDAAKKYFSIVLTLIKKHDPNTVLPGSEGLTVEQIKEIIKTTTVTTRAPYLLESATRRILSRKGGATRSI